LVIKNADPKEFAFFGHVKLGDPMRKYSDNEEFALNAANRLLKDSRIRHSFENDYTTTAPISMSLRLIVSNLRGITKNMLLTVLGMVMFLAYLVSKTLIEGNLQEKTYENAMLRTLGWN